MLAAAVALLFFFWSDQFLAPPDCAFYWAWADALLRNNTLNFLPAFDALEIPRWYGYITETGRLANDWPMGTGLLLLPAVPAGPIWAHGWLLLLCVLVMAYWWRTVEGSNFARGMSLFGMIIGTPLMFYGLFGPFFSHVASFILVTGFLVSWARSHQDATSYRWLHLGILLGLATLVRPQNILLAGVFAADIPALLRAARSNRRAFALNTGMPLLLGTALGLAPRLPAYAVLYGNAFALPKLEEMQWFRPNLLLTLLSDYHGILPWTPIYAVSMVGLIYGLKNNRRLSTGLLIVLFVQLYVNAANEVWWSGGSFGNRRLTDYSIIMAWGLLFLQSAPRPIVRWVAVCAIIICCAWTLTLALAERRLILPLDRYVPFSSENFFGSLLDVYRQFPLTWESLTRSVSKDTLSRAAVATILFAAIGLMLTLTRKQKQYARLTRTGRLLLVLCPVVLVSWLSIAAARTAPLPPRVQEQFGRTSTILWDNYAELAGYHLVRREFADAESAASKAIQIRPDAPAAYWYSSIALLELGQTGEALQRLEDLLALNPNHAAARQLLQQFSSTSPARTGTEKPASEPGFDWRVKE